MKVLSRPPTGTLSTCMLVCILMLTACSSAAPTNSSNLLTSHDIFATSAMQWDSFHPSIIPQATITAIDPTSGTVRWMHHQDLDPYHQFMPPTQVNGVLYFFTDGTYNLKDTSGIPPAGSIMAVRASDGKLLWNTTVGVLPIPPIIANNVAYVVASDASKNGHEWIYALDASNGHQLWRTDITTMSNFRNDLQLVDGVLFLRSNTFCFDSCGTAYLLAARAIDGKLLWHQSFDGNISLDPLLVANGLAYVSVPTPDNTQVAEQLLALNPQDGHQVWSVPGVSTNGLVMHNGDLYNTLQLRSATITPGPVYVVALDGQTGKELWRVPTALSTVVRGADDTTLYLSTDIRNATQGTYQNYLAALRMSDGSTLWQVPIMGDYGLKVGTNHTLYGSAIVVSEDSQRRVTKTTIFAFALDAATGNNRWLHPFTLDISDKQHQAGSMLDVIGNIYYFSRDGTTLITLDAQTGQIIWQTTVASSLVGVAVAP